MKIKAVRRNAEPLKAAPLLAGRTFGKIPRGPLSRLKAYALRLYSAALRVEKTGGSRWGIYGLKPRDPPVFYLDGLQPDPAGGLSPRGNPRPL